MDFLDNLDLGKGGMGKMELRPTQPCYTCKGNNFWLRDDGRWGCNQCHPDPGKHPHYEISNPRDELKALLERVRLGNEKLWGALEQIKGLADDKDEWSRQMDRWVEAKEKLLGYVVKLKASGHNDCLYLDEKGKKTRGCLHNADGFYCIVCPCDAGNPYWEDELMGLSSPKVTHKESEQTEFVEKLGGMK